jgi:NADPH:quinone reductase-like Zn-dependent oxidoreductase
MTRPKRITILGFEPAGEVEAIGRDVKSFRKGDLPLAIVGTGLIWTEIAYLGKL